MLVGDLSTACPTVAAVQDALKVIEEKLKPHLVALTPDERKELPKMSDKTAPFVEKVLDYAESAAEFAPAYLDVPELKKDVDAVSTLTLLARPIEQLSETLNDTIMLAGSEAFVASLAYYNSVKQAAKMNVPGAKTIHEDLAKRKKLGRWVFEVGGVLRMSPRKGQTTPRNGQTSPRKGETCAGRAKIPAGRAKHSQERPKHAQEGVKVCREGLKSPRGGSKSPGKGANDNWKRAEFVRHLSKH